MSDGSEAGGSCRSSRMSAVARGSRERPMGTLKCTTTPEHGTNNTNKHSDTIGHHLVNIAI